MWVKFVQYLIRKYTMCDAQISIHKTKEVDEYANNKISLLKILQ